MVYLYYSRMVKVKEKKIIYSLFMVVFVGLIFSLTWAFLLTNFETQGTSNIVNKYYDMILSNSKINFDTSSSIKIDNEKSILIFTIPNLLEFKKSNSFDIDLTNIGNIDAVVSDYYIFNTESNINNINANVDISLEKGTIITGGETKKLNVKVTYNNLDKIESPYYNFSIKFLFNEKSN